MRFLATVLLLAGATPDASARRTEMTILVAEHDRVREFDASGREVRTIRVEGFDDLSDAEPLRNGNLLVCNSGPGKVLEVTRSGEVVWEIPAGGYPSDAQKLPNGNVLVALRNPGRVAELDRRGKTVWEVPASDSAISAYRLADGRTLMSVESRGVFHLDAKGEQTRAFATRIQGIRPWRVRPARGGHILVVDRLGNTVSEVDAEGLIVWQRDKLSEPRDAVRLPDGRTLILETTGRRVLEVRANGAARPLIENLGTAYRIELDQRRK